MHLFFAYLQKKTMDKVMNVWKWHDSLSENYENEPLCCKQCQYKLLSPSNRLLPFQFTRQPSLATIEEWKLINKDTNDVIFLQSSLIKIRKYVGVDYVYYEGNMLGTAIPCGYYNSVITDTIGNAKYSETIYVMGYEEGGNIVVNPDFDDFPDDWTVSGGWAETVNGICKSSGSVQTLSQNVGLVMGKIYRVQVQYYSHVGQAFIIDIAGGSSISYPATGAAGTYSFTGVAGATGIVTLTSTTLNALCVVSIRVFEVMDNIGKCNYHLKWRNCTELAGNIYKNTLFYNEFYIEDESEIYNRTAKNVIEVRKNIDGSETPIFQRTEFTQDLYLGRVPNYVADALNALQAHDEIYLIAKNTTDISEILSVRVESAPAEITNYCFNEVNLSFQYDDAIVTDSCCDGELLELDEAMCVGVARLKLEGNPDIYSFFMQQIIINGVNDCVLSGINSAFNPDFKLQVTNELETMATPLPASVNEFTFDFIDNEIILTVLVSQSQINTTAPLQIYLNALISTSNVVHVPFIYQCCKQYRKYINSHIDYFSYYNLDAADAIASGVCAVPYRNVFTIEVFEIDGVSVLPAVNFVNIDFDVSKNPTNAVKTDFVAPYPHSEYDTVMNLINSVSPLIQFVEGMLYLNVLDNSIKFHVRFKVEIFYCDSGVLTLDPSNTDWALAGGGTIDFFHNGSTADGVGDTIEQYGYQTYIAECVI